MSFHSEVIPEKWHFILSFHFRSSCNGSRLLWSCSVWKKAIMMESWWQSSPIMCCNCFVPYWYISLRATVQGYLNHHLHVPRNGDSSVCSNIGLHHSIQDWLSPKGQWNAVVGEVQLLLLWHEKRRLLCTSLQPQRVLPFSLTCDGALSSLLILFLIVWNINIALQ